MSAFACPMHPEVAQDGAGRCPNCGMRLVEEGGAMEGHHGGDGDGAPTTMAALALYLLLG